MKSDWKETRWKSAKCCVECDTWLSYLAIFESDGVCPVCGSTNPNSDSIVKHYKRIYKERYRRSWRTLWMKAERYLVWKDQDPRSDINSPEYDPLWSQQT